MECGNVRNCAFARLEKVVRVLLLWPVMWSLVSYFICGCSRYSFAATFLILQFSFSGGTIHLLVSNCLSLFNVQLPMVYGQRVNFVPHCHNGILSSAT